MPKRIDIKKILIIGSGPIVIGQSAEFDYAGTQACLALKEEGYSVILANSNPATIMTDTQIADKVYMEPLNAKYISKIISRERPDALLPTLGGQTGLNIASELSKNGILEKFNCKIIGTDIESISNAENRLLFKNLCESIGQQCLNSQIALSEKQAIKIANKIGYPVILRPAFTLGGTGGGFANNDKECKIIAKKAIAASPVNQVLVEQSAKGYKEIEFELLRDYEGNSIIVCGMENVDPVGVHTGDSMVVSPIQTLNSKEINLLKKAAINIGEKLNIIGACNIQFAVRNDKFKYYAIEANPRVSRSSALASKATAYPIARVSSKIAIGMNLDEIIVGNSHANFEPNIDYIVCKIARFPFDKFKNANRSLGTQMKSTGEVMGIGKNFEESLLKAIRSLENSAKHLYLKKFVTFSDKDLLNYIKIPSDDWFFAIAECIRRKIDIEKISYITSISMFFLKKIEHITSLEKIVQNNPTIENLRECKKYGFSNEYLAPIFKMNNIDFYKFTKQKQIFPNFEKINASNNKSLNNIPYLYSTFNGKSKFPLDKCRKIIVLGSGPIRIGQGIEFDYSTVHAIWAIKQKGYKAIVINNNPETVSTDYSMSDKLYFEPLTPEDVMHVIDYEKPDGVIVSLGGQTSINLSNTLKDFNVNIIGTNIDAINKAENRDLFLNTAKKCNVPVPYGHAVTSIESGKNVAKNIGYPVLVRPSFVLGGRAMKIVHNDDELIRYLTTAVNINEKQPVLIDKYIKGIEVEVDAICDGTDVAIPGIMQLVEAAGIHSGDSISVFPPYSLNDNIKKTIEKYTIKLGLEIGIIGLFNIQFIIDSNNEVFVIEVNPRSSRSVPFLSKSSGIPMANIATKVMLGESLKNQGYKTGLMDEGRKFYVKSPVFSFSKLNEVDPCLTTEMKSTGEAIGCDKTFSFAAYKSLIAANVRIVRNVTVLILFNKNKVTECKAIIRRFYNLDFNIEITSESAQSLKNTNIIENYSIKTIGNTKEIIKNITNKRLNYIIYIGSDEQIGNDDALLIRKTAIKNNITLLTSLDTINLILSILEDKDIQKILE